MLNLVLCFGVSKFATKWEIQALQKLNSEYHFLCGVWPSAGLNKDFLTLLRVDID